MSDFSPENVVKSPKTRPPAPPGYDGASGASSTSSAKSKIVPVKKQDPAAISELKTKKAWEVAMGPAKSIPMNLFMAYMAGNSLQIIPIMMTFMLFINPIKAIFTETNAHFKPLTTAENASDILLAKVVFVLCQVACMSVGVWKLNGMGLIPNSRSDWLAWEETVKVAEWSSLF